MDRSDGSQPSLWAYDDEEAVQPPERPVEPSDDPASAGETLQPVRADDLWGAIFSRENLARALHRVEQNKGAPGPDGMRVEALRFFFNAHWPEVHRAGNQHLQWPPGCLPVRWASQGRQ